MEDRIDFFLLEQNAIKKPMDAIGKDVFYKWFYMTNEGIEIKIYGSKIDGFVQLQTPPKPAFFYIYKEYYPNGYLKLKGKRMGGGATMVGEWEYYDENGHLTSKKNEDEKFGKFGYNELLLFLHQKEYINLETGDNREKVDFRYDVETKQWEIYIINDFHWITEYIIDGETGEILDMKEFQGGKM